MATTKTPTQYPDGRPIETDGSIHVDYAPKHSTAPWRIDVRFNLVDANGQRISSMIDPSDADAALIAAAPILLETLKELAALGSDIAPYYQDRIKSAISAAEPTETTETNISQINVFSKSEPK